MTLRNPGCLKRNKWAKAIRQAAKNRAIALQVQEYIDRYYPEMGQVEVEVSPTGAFARAYLRKPK